MLGYDKKLWHIMKIRQIDKEKVERYYQKIY